MHRRKGSIVKEEGCTIRRGNWKATASRGNVERACSRFLIRRAYLFHLRMLFPLLFVLAVSLSRGKVLLESPFHCFTQRKRESEWLRTSSRFMDSLVALEFQSSFLRYFSFHSLSVSFIRFLLFPFLALLSFFREIVIFS